MVNYSKKMSSLMHKVFVYGTLKQGEANHHWLQNASNGTANFIISAKTTTKYPLVIGTRYNVPFLLDKPGAGNFVSGEVYEVDSNMLTRLDVLEDHPNFYVRELHDVIPNNTERTINCWIYLLKTFPPLMLSKPHLESYSGAPPNPQYIERSARVSDVLAKNDLDFITA